MASRVGGDDIEINLTPLLDLVLQLIMFFMITVNFVAADQFDENVSLPVAQSAVPLEATAEKWVFLNLDSKGKLVGTQGNMGLDSPEKIKAYLVREKEGLEREARVGGQKGELKIVVVLRADKNCRYRDVWQVVDSCQRAGFRRWQLRVMTRAA
jgi:biopolymer transport protein ExbD